MIIYTLQQHRASGDVHALRYDADNMITGISDALHYHDVAALTPTDLPSLDYEPYSGNPDGTGEDGFLVWDPPTRTYVVTRGSEDQS